ncbi:MAG: hypothetical protein Q4B59_05675 [Lachnospiraceae bacterium]|nr:hypothetical protein [Lachnospiraceae bacterium]
MKIWGKIWKQNHVIADNTIEDLSNDTRTHKVFNALDELCIRFDLSRPIWLESNVQEFKRHKRVHFNQDSFIEQIEFDSFEMQVLEED